VVSTCERGEKSITWILLLESFMCKNVFVSHNDAILCRYSRHDKRSKLPGWILSHLRDAHLNLSTDMALHIAREVCQPHLFFLLLLLGNKQLPA
jgi:hypothetical protein